MTDLNMHSRVGDDSQPRGGVRAVQGCPDDGQSLHSDASVSALSTQERAVIALAELGYPARASSAFSTVRGRQVSTVAAPPGSIPLEMAWKAYVVAKSPSISCLACYRWERPSGRGLAERKSQCHEKGLYTHDCGADRSEWEERASHEPATGRSHTEL